ncbi:MAG: sulfatase-like hydrolase/transferase [Candidatus Hydrogenedens sp.]|nr:sulfatase-like hydrolase/transferase [Candidatus Hydrogenedens sp.]
MLPNSLLRNTSNVARFLCIVPALLCAAARAEEAAEKRPNILFAIADDWSWPHASIAGAKFVATPNFDRVAREGVLFENAFCAAPQCSPNRAAILSGRHIWQLREAGTHSSLFPKDIVVSPDLFEQAGYHIGFTGKGWGPGNWEDSGRHRNPAGPEFSDLEFDSVPAGINDTDYAANFEAFLEQRPEGAPFYFWYGGKEPHRGYLKGAGVKAGKRLEDVALPAFLPEAEDTRSDLLDYGVEVEWFDTQLGKMIAKLESLGELDNTIVIVTSDNGMPFPRAKANVYEYGVHVPLAIRWGAHAAPGRTVKDLFSFFDYAPTLLSAAGIAVPESMTGKSFLPLLIEGVPGPNDFVLFGRERHSHARFDNLGYPARAIRTPEALYIHNLKPDRWPAGDPDAFYDIDDGPTKGLLVEHQAGYPALYDAAVGKRKEHELFDVSDSMDCTENLAGEDASAETLKALQEKLGTTLAQQGDPRALGKGDVFESYPRFGGMRPKLGGFAKQGEYNPKYQE